MEQKFKEPKEFTPCYDAVKGDYVKLSIAIFGQYNYKKRTAQYLGSQKIEGTIIKESYGKVTAQHTFTIELLDGSKKLIKGRNFYKNCVRAIWEDEKQRDELTEEKHKRGTEAKKNRNFYLNN